MAGSATTSARTAANPGSIRAAPCPAPPPAASTRPRLLLPGVIALTAVAAVAVRLLFVNEVNSDYRVFLDPWYDALANGGGFAAVGREIGNYNPPYLYLLAAATCTCRCPRSWPSS